MMGKVILVSATPLEHGGLKELNGIPIFQVGIGKINAASNLTEILWNEEPDVVINFGSCGNLKNHKVSEVIEVGSVYNNIDVHQKITNVK
jgi:adenosylhomocysteine nucleosidase